MKIFLASGFVLRPMKLRMNRFVEIVENFPCTRALLGFSKDGHPIFLDGHWGKLGCPLPDTIEEAINNVGKNPKLEPWCSSNKNIAENDKNDLGQEISQK